MTDASIYKRVARADDIGPHYSIYRVVPGNGEAALREMFPDAEANDMNFVLFSTSGVHGSYSTIEDCEAAATNPDESPSLTFVIVQPRLVCMRYGTLDVSPENVDFLKKLRASSWSVMATIGAPQTE